MFFTSSVKATQIDVDPKDAKPEHRTLMESYYNQNAHDIRYGLIDKITKVQVKKQPFGVTFYYEFNLIISNCFKDAATKKLIHKDCVLKPGWVSCHNMSTLSMETYY